MSAFRLEARTFSSKSLDQTFKIVGSKPNMFVINKVMRPFPIEYATYSTNTWGKKGPETVQATKTSSETVFCDKQPHHLLYIISIKIYI